MENLALKIRIVVLWLFMAVAWHRCTAFWEAGVIEQILAGEWAEFQTPEMLLFGALAWLVPLTMAFLSVTLKDTANRRANLVMGVVFIPLSIIHFIIHLEQPTAHALLIVGSTAVVAALIVWYAWKWPTQEA